MFHPKQVHVQVWVWYMISGKFHDVFLLSFDKSEQLCRHLPKLRRAPVLGCHQTSFLLLRWVIIKPSPHHLSVLYIFLWDTLWEWQYSWRRTHSQPACWVCKASECVLGLLTVRVGVKDTIGIPPWISPDDTVLLLGLSITYCSTAMSQ